MLLSKFPMTFRQTQKGMRLFIAQLMTILVLIWMVFIIIWEMFHGRMSLNLVLLQLLLNFPSRPRLELINISLTISIRSSLIQLYGLQLLVMLPRLIKITFFVWINKSSASYLGLIFAKEFLKLPKLFILIKQKIYYFPEFSHNFQALTIFWWIANSVLDKSEPTTPPSFNGPKVLSCASGKTKLFAKKFSKNSNLDDSGISLPAFLSRTNLKLHNIHVTPKLVKKVINNLDPLKASGTDCIPVVVLRK